MSNKIVRIMSIVVLFSLMVSLATVAIPQIKANADAHDLTVTGGPYLSLWSESVTGDDVATYVDLVDDLDGDGYLDVLVVYTAGTPDNGIAEVIAIKGSDGTILWRETITGFGVSIRRELVDDISGDGLPDAIIGTGVGEISNKTYNLIAVQGDNGAHLWQQSIIGEDPWMEALKLTDLDGDSDLDVLVSSRVGPTDNKTFSIIAKIGSTGIHLWEESMTDDRAAMYADVVDDVDGDGISDVLLRTTTGQWTYGTHEIIAIRGIDGTHLWQESITGDEPSLSAYGVSDLNGDTKADVLVTTRLGTTSNRTVDIIAKRGEDGFHFWQETFNGSNALGQASEVSDLDGDGYADVLVKSEVGPSSNSTIEVSAKKGSDGTQLWQESITGYTPILSAKEVGNMDGDGVPDFLVSSRVGSSINRTSELTALKGNNGAHLWQETVIGQNSIMSDREIYDFDGDGMLDVLADYHVGPDSNIRYSWMSIKGNNGVQLWQQSITGESARMWVENVGDADGDSKPDFFVDMMVGPLSSRSAKANMQSGNGGALLWSTGLLTGDGAIYGLDGVGDFNGDGMSDVIVVSSVGSPTVFADIWAYRGYDMYSFWHESINGEQAAISASIVEDLDGNGIQDVLVHLGEGPDSSKTIEVIAKEGYGTTDFWQQSLTGESAHLSARGVEDIDGDGKTDVIVDQSLMTSFGMLYQTIAKNGHYGSNLWMAESDPEIRFAYHEPDYFYDSKADNDLDGDGKVEIVLYIEDGIVYGIGVDIPTSMDSDYAFLPPTVDGDFSPGEWTGPQLLIEYPIPTNVYFSNDDAFLYVCVDAADGAGGDFTQNGSDHCLLVFDTDHDEYTSEGRENMFKLYGNGYKEHRVAHSDGSHYWISDPECDFDACPEFPGLEGVVGFGTSPNSPLNHRIYEFKIPLGLLGASPGDTIGFASPTDPESIPYDGDTVRHNIWPSDATATDLATWGDLVLASEPSPSAVPTLSQWGMIGMGILLAAALVWSVRRRWVTSTDKI